MLFKEMLHPASRVPMADELFEAYARRLLDAHVCLPELAIAWRGGEPTLSRSHAVSAS